MVPDITQKLSDAILRFHSIKNMFSSIGTMLQYLSTTNPTLRRISAEMIYYVRQIDQEKDFEKLLAEIKKFEDQIAPELKQIYASRSKEQAVRTGIRVIIKAQKTLQILIQEIHQEGQIKEYPSPELYCYFYRLIRFINLTSKYKTRVSKKKISEMAATGKKISFCFRQTGYYFPAEFIASIRDIILNSRKYTGMDGLIEVTFDEIGNYTQVMVKDNGIGIEKEELHKITNLHYRGKNAMEKTTGFGIGLTKAKYLCQKYGGDLLIESILNQYTIVVLKIKKQLLETSIANQQVEK